MWVTEFNINFVACFSAKEFPNALKLAPGFSPKRQSRFVTTDPTKSPDTLPIITEAAYGFRFVGDLHDRMWTCYKVVDMGNVPDKVVAAREEKYMDRWGNQKRMPWRCWMQRKCIEGCFVLEGLEMVTENTEIILDLIEKEEDYMDPDSLEVCIFNMIILINPKETKSLIIAFINEPRQLPRLYFLRHLRQPTSAGTITIPQ